MDFIGISLIAIKRLFMPFLQQGGMQLLPRSFVYPAIAMLLASAYPSMQERAPPAPFVPRAPEQQGKHLSGYIQSPILPLTVTATPEPVPKVVQSPSRYRITFYYCQQEEGFPTGDGGGFCNNFASGQQRKPEHSGSVAACQGFPLGTRLLIDRYGAVSCFDTGYLGRNQVDIYFATNGDFWRSRLPALNGYSTVSVAR